MLVSEQIYDNFGDMESWQLLDAAEEDDGDIDNLYIYLTPSSGKVGVPYHTVM